MNLLYITFGKDSSIHLQAVYSIASFIKQPSFVKRVVVITDEPSMYQLIQSSITLKVVDAAILNEWKGPHQFFWRIKIKGIEWVANTFPGEAVVYADTDTFLTESAMNFALALQSNTAFMHENEGPLALKNSKTERKMWQQVNGKQFGSYLINKNNAMWNAGIVAFPNNTNAAEIQLALAICDDMCAKGVTPRLIEQFALSVALSHHYSMQEAKHFIKHYWSAKTIWNKALMQLFSTYLLQNLTAQQIITSLSQLPLQYLPIGMKEKNTARRLKKWVDKLFPTKTNN